MKKIRVAIAEDNNLLACSIQEKLELFSDEVYFKYRAANSRELLEMLRKDHAVDIILMDIEMPGMDGIAGTEIISATYPQIKIIMLTVFDDEDKIFRSIQAGASGYLLKDEPPDKIREGIVSIMQGGAPMSPTIAAKSLELLRNPKLADRPAAQEVTLSVRQVEVLEQLSKGLNYLEIAENLFISPATVRKHIENIYDRLQVHNKMEAVNKAQKHRII